MAPCHVNTGDLVSRQVSWGWWETWGSLFTQQVGPVPWHMHTGDLFSQWVSLTTEYDDRLPAVIECINKIVVDLRLAVVADYNSSRTAARKTTPFINVSDQFMSHCRLVALSLGPTEHRHHLHHCRVHCYLVSYGVIMLDSLFKNLNRRCTCVYSLSSVSMSFLARRDNDCYKEVASRSEE